MSNSREKLSEVSVVTRVSESTISTGQTPPRKEHGWNHRQAVQAGCSPGREHARVRMIFHRPEGDEVFEEGEAYYAGPGHTGE
jgi:hypothetical protein